MASKKSKPPARSPDELRTLILRHFYDRNKNATSARGKRGFAAKITDIKRELKTAAGLTQQEVLSNLNYLLSQGWIEEDKVTKTVPLPSGTIIPQTTSYYKISAAGIDKIEGPGDFTMDKFRGIRIEATGQNIITVGDGNQVNAKFKDVASSLVELKDAIRTSGALSESAKLDAVADVDTIQSQLARATPNAPVIKGVWEQLKRLDAIAGLTDKVIRVGSALAPFLGAAG